MLEIGCAWSKGSGERLQGHPGPLVSCRLPKHWKDCHNAKVFYSNKLKYLSIDSKTIYGGFSSFLTMFSIFLSCYQMKKTFDQSKFKGFADKINVAQIIEFL